MLTVDTTLATLFAPLAAAVPAANPWQVTTVAQRAANALAEGNVWVSAGYLVLGLAAVGVTMALMGLVLIYVERKLAAHFQCRLGPMRVGCISEKPLGIGTNRPRWTTWAMR